MVKIVAVSDTHRNQPTIPECDIVIHAGDACSYGTSKELKQFIKWYRDTPAEHKIYVPGNHDKTMERDKGIDLFKGTGITVLIGESIEIDGCKIWGSPVTPEFYDWAFMLKRGEVLATHWNKIPLDTDILVTHGPPYGHGDLVPHGSRVAGCLELLKRVMVVKPRFHVFGHIHEGAGITQSDEVDTIFINAAHVNGDYVPTHKPTEFVWNPKR